MNRRAEQVDETRLRITEAAVRLHTTVGPANTSIASVAEEAGVTRLTVYRHFETLDGRPVRGVHGALAGQPPRSRCVALARSPIRARASRAAFGELYDWYRENADDLFPINRDRAALPASARLVAEERTAFLADAILAGETPGGPAGVQFDRRHPAPDRVPDLARARDPRRPAPG